MAIEYNFTLDMDRSKRDNNIAYARTGDIDSITINADLVFGGAAYTPSGTNAFFECITPNGRSVRASAEKTGSSVSVEVPSAAFQAAGVINVAYFRFESGASDNPTYVESTEPFAIIVREGIGNSIDAGDYIEEWRKLADQLEAAVAEVEKKAEQAETAINEQKTEVDQLKAQAQKAIAGDVTEVEGVAQSAIAAINKEKADVADAAEDISAAGEQAINSFNSKGTSAINKFNIDGTSAINQFNTNAGSKLDEVDGMITEAQGDVDAAITQLENKTQDAIDAAQDALDGTIATNLQNAINRTLKLDVADMTNIPDNSSLSSFTNVGSYCCKTAATAATVGDCPIDDSPFNMYVFSSATSGQVMQLVVPIDLNGKPTAEWHVRFGTSSAMDKWSVIGGGADIAAGLGIDVTGDAKKTVALDTTAFYQHHEAVSIIQGSTEVTGGGRIKKLTVYGNTRQNLWVNPSGTSNGVTVTSNENGSMTLSGSATAEASIQTHKIYIIRPSTTYSIGTNEAPTQGVVFAIYYFDSDGKYAGNMDLISAVKKQDTFTTPAEFAYAVFIAYAPTGVSPSGTYRVMLNEGSEAQPWCPPGLNGVDKLSVMCAGRNLLDYNDILTRINVVSDDGVLKSANPDSDDRALAYSDCDYHLALPPGTYVLLLDVLKSTTNNYSSLAIVKQNDYFVTSGNSFVSTGIKSLQFSVTDLPVGILAKVFDAEVRMAIYRNGDEIEEWEPYTGSTTHIDLSGHTLNSLPDGTRDELTIDGGGNVVIDKVLGFTKDISSETVTEYIAGISDENASRVSFNVGTLNSELGYGLLVPGYTPLYSNKDRSCYISYGKVVICDNRFTSLEVALKMLKGIWAVFLIYPQTVKLEGTVVMPDLASPSYVIYASSDVPVEIEAEVVKVDYLPAPDVYTREEVDRKIQDAGMPAVVPVSKGGTGVTTAAAERNRLGLGNTTGALPVANGGTGKTTAKAAQNALLANIDTVSTDVGDDSFFVGYYQSPSDATGALYKRVSSDIWNWIVGKIRSTFGFTSSNVLPVSNGGTGLTKAPSMLVNLESASAANPLASDPRPGVSGELPLTRGGTGGTSAAAARTNLGVYSKAEVDGKVPKVVYGTGNIPSNAENGTIYIQYRS